MSMATSTLNLSKFSLHKPISFPTNKHHRTNFCIRATSEEKSSTSSLSTISPPPNFKAPEPKRFVIRSDNTFEILGASLSLFFRLATGVFVSGYSASLVSKDEIPPNEYALQLPGITVQETSKVGARPEKPIEIYEFEGCPFCRKVREIASVLDLDVIYYPCPRNGPNFRPKVVEMGGKQQFPYMVDPNTSVSMYESDEIIRYLVGTYGDGNIPWTLKLGFVTSLTCGLAMLSRITKGSKYTPAKLPPKPLKLWAYEGSPFCKLVREVLVELELPHLFVNCARGSSKRNILFEKTGHFQVPYLEDPNTGIEMFESAEIVEYIRATYTL